MNCTARRLGTAAGLAAFGVALLFPFDTGTDHFFWGPLFDAGHYPLFFLLTLVLAAVLPKRFAGLPRWCTAPYTVSAGVVLAVELIQPFFGRDASLPDIINGLLGTAAAGVFLEVFGRRTSTAARLVTAAALAGVFLALLLPMLPAARALSWRSQNFPVLARFADRQELLLWRPIISDEILERKTAELELVSESLAENGLALQVVTRPGRWAGVWYAAGEMPWQEYSRLELRIINPSQEPFTLHLRIDDNQKCEFMHQRYNGTRELQPGTNLLSVPLDEVRKAPRDRELDLSNIRKLLLFVHKHDPPRVFHLDSVKLTGSS